MPVFDNKQDFDEYEKRAALPISAYTSLSASINKNHDLRAYKENADLVCSRCGADLGFLVYSRQVECHAVEVKKNKKKRLPRHCLAGFEPVSDVPDFELVSPV